MLTGVISESYRDAAGRTKDGVSGYLTGYYGGRNSKTSLVLRLLELELSEPGRATADVLSAVAREPLDWDGVQWERIAADEVDAMVWHLDLVDEGEGSWKVVNVSWRAAQPDDLG